MVACLPLVLDEITGLGGFKWPDVTGYWLNPAYGKSRCREAISDEWSPMGVVEKRGKTIKGFRELCKVDEGGAFTSGSLSIVTPGVSTFYRGEWAGLDNVAGEN